MEIKFETIVLRLGELEVVLGPGTVDGKEVDLSSPEKSLKEAKRIVRRAMGNDSISRLRAEGVCPLELAAILARMKP